MIRCTGSGSGGGQRSCLIFIKAAGAEIAYFAPFYAGIRRLAPRRRPINRTMSLVRRFVIALVAVAVTAMPASAGFAAPVKASQNASAEMAATMAADCQHGGAMPAEHHGPKPANDCASMASCAAICFNYAGTAVPSVPLPSNVSRLPPVRASTFVASRIGSPPFRPPRV